jgi:alkanesulfonate monooxygenase SsuD/methylene tetrahydromethanopterin reductase-like flavin-dependent oxidoreductase (luciferase family)
VDEDEAVTRNLFRRSLTAYVTVPQYNKFFREIGYDKEAGIAMDAWNAGDRKKALESIPDDMVEKIFVFGSAEKCRKRLDEYGRAGITTTALQFASFAKTPEERRTNILRAMEKLQG